MKLKKKIDMEVVPKKNWARLILFVKNRKLIYSGQKATKIFGRKVVKNWSKIGRCTKMGHWLELLVEKWASPQNDQEKWSMTSFKLNTFRTLHSDELSEIIYASRHLGFYVRNIIIEKSYKGMTFLMDYERYTFVFFIKK